MKSGRIIGRVMATRKVPSLKGVKLLLVAETDWQGRDTGKYLVAADAVGAGAGEWIFFVQSRDASIAVSTNPPIDAAIVGIIDGTDIEEK